MLQHGHAKADFRNRHLHQVALEKLRQNPELRSAVLDLLRRWLKDKDLCASRPWLERWQEILTTWPFEQMVEQILRSEEGQTLRQCSPLGAALTAPERWKALEEANRQFDQLAHTASV